MKHLIILSLLISASSHAQEGQEQQPVENEATTKTKKRPSWSQGLPERQNSLTPSASMNRLKMNKDPVNAVEDDRKPEVTELPNVEIDLGTTQPMMALEIKSTQPTYAPRRGASYFFDNSDVLEKKEVVAPAVNPLIANYKWAIVKTTPIDVPQNFDDNKALELNIHINPKGEVTRVTEAGSSIPKKVFKSAEKSILKWKFQAPSEIGITETISKTFTIDINTDS